MNIYQPGNAISLTIPFLGPDGSSLAATEGTYRVIDGAGVEVKAPADLNLTEETSEIDLTFDADVNTLGDGLTSDVRSCVFTLVTEEATYQMEFNWGLRALDPLTVGVNSFQTYPAAEMLATMMTDLPGWGAATREQRLGALMQAREQLCEFQYRVLRADAQSYLVPDHPVAINALGAYELASYDAETLALLPAPFLNALRQAQVVQADALLGSSPTEVMRDQGILSQTTGESSVMFRQGAKPLDYPVCKRAVALLRRYMVNPFTAHIGRA